MDILPEDATARTLFFRVLKHGSLEAFKTLVNLGADVTWRDEDVHGFSGLHLCLKEVEKLEFLLSKGADVNQTDGFGMTTLMWACVGGLPATVERLCQVPGVDLNCRDDSQLKQTAVMHAVGHNKLRCVEKFRAVTGVDWDVVNSFGFSAIMEAVSLGHTAIVEALLPVSSLVLTNTDGDSMAHLAVKASKPDSLKILQLLCQDGRVDWNTKDREGNCAVLIALENNQVERFRTLVRTPGVDTDITDAQGRNLMQLIMEKSSPQFKKILWGLDLMNIEDRFSWCPVCHEKYSPELHVFLCVRGHFVCGDCRARLDPNHCPVCRGEIAGRAVDFEKFLQGLHSDTV